MFQHAIYARYSILSIGPTSANSYTSFAHMHPVNHLAAFPARHIEDTTNLEDHATLDPSRLVLKCFACSSNASQTSRQWQLHLEKSPDFPIQGCGFHLVLPQHKISGWSPTCTTPDDATRPCECHSACASRDDCESQAQNYKSDGALHAVRSHQTLRTIS